MIFSEYKAVSIKGQSPLHEADDRGHCARAGWLYLGNRVPGDAKAAAERTLSCSCIDIIISTITRSEEVTGTLSQGMVGPVWRTLVRAIPASANRIIP